MDSLLAHLSHRFVTQEENLATEGLAYLLTTHGVAANAMTRFVRSFGADLPERLLFRAQAHSTEDGSIPDLVGSGPDGRNALICEIKFWAGLTANQPVAYLSGLPKDKPGLLLFITPERRERYLWPELLARLDAAGIGHDGDAGAPRKAARDAQTMLAITTWPRLLDVLEIALQEANEREGLSDLRQLRGLTQRMDAEAFLPISSEELTGPIGQRMLGLGNAINDAVTELVHLGVVDTKRLRAAATFAWFGRWLRLGSLFGLLRVSYSSWSSMAPTPLWLRIRETPSGAVREALSPLAHEQPTRLHLRPDSCHVPIFLPVGADLAQTRALIVKTVTEVRDLLSAVEDAGQIPEESEDASPEETD